MKQAIKLNNFIVFSTIKLFFLEMLFEDFNALKHVKFMALQTEHKDLIAIVPKGLAFGVFNASCMQKVS